MQRQGNDLLIREIEHLRNAIRVARTAHPFHIDAWVVLPDHMHCIWTFPPGDDHFTTRWRAIKAVFSRALPSSEYRSRTRASRGERGIWQRRFWEHAIRDERDYAAHMDYIHFNPVKHGYVQRARDWPYSTFGRLVEKGIYSVDWAGGDIDDIAAGE